MDWNQAGTLALMAVELGLGGLVTGILAGLLGIGGGGILVPILFEVFRIQGVPEDVRMHLCVGTSLAIIIPTSLRSFSGHKAKGAVDMEIVRVMGPLVAVGVVSGAFIAAYASGGVLKTVYIISCALMSARLFAGGDRLNVGSEMPGALAQRIVGLVVGLFSTLIGIGGGVYITAFMSLYKRPIHQAVATASGFGPIIAIPAAIGYVIAGWKSAQLPPFSLGYVNLLAAVLVMPASVYAAPIGVKLAHGISRRALELAFATFLAVVSVRFLLTFF